MLRREVASDSAPPPLPPGEVELSSLDDVTLDDHGEGRFSVTTRFVRFVGQESLARRALHALGSSGARGEAHTLARAEIVGVAIETTALGFKTLRIRRRQGADWVAHVGARDPSALLGALSSPSE